MGFFNRGRRAQDVADPALSDSEWSSAGERARTVVAG